jgi:NAD(P)-dependent dehydrogenase (short-subunit alcohol dehydrogenase family)
MKSTKFKISQLIMLVVFFTSFSTLQAQEKWNGKEQKVILITGTASGIGKTTAKHLIEKGHIVYGGDIQFQKNKYLDSIGGHSIDMDVTDTAMVNAGVKRIIEEQGRIDVLYNNAGWGLYAPAEESTEEDYRHQMEVNLFGVHNVTRAVLPYMREQKSGRILVTSSMGGKIYMPLGAWYHASKHAIEGYFDCLRLELKHFNISVVIIEPGAINTNFGNVTTEYMQKYIEGTNYSHMIDPFVNMMKDMTPEQMEKMGSEPIVIAEVVEKAIRKRNPKTRYKKGKMAKFMIFYRNLFGDKAFDRLMLRTFN